VVVSFLVSTFARTDARRLRRPLGVLSVAILGFGLSACSQVSDSAALRMDGTAISRDRLETELKAFEQVQILNARPGEESALKNEIHKGTDQSTFSPQFTASVLNDLLIDTVIADEFTAKKLKLPVLSAEQKKTLVESIVRPQDEQNKEPKRDLPAIYAKMPAAFRERVERRFLQFEGLTADAKKNVGDAKSIFEKNKAKYGEVCASHILVKTEKEATAIVADLAKGGDFAAIAKKQSLDPGSGANGGELGCASPAGYVPEFAAATISQPLNKVGAPVKTQYGFHIIKVLKRTDGTFDKAKAQIEAEMATAPDKAVSDALIGRLKKAKITVDPKFAKLGTSEQGFPQIVSKATEPNLETPALQSP
jgi:parvulin-like peptidyl-prolyl isomerase